MKPILLIVALLAFILLNPKTGAKTRRVVSERLDGLRGGAA